MSDDLLGQCAPIDDDFEGLHYDGTECFCAGYYCNDKDPGSLPKCTFGDGGVAVSHPGSVIQNNVLHSVLVLGLASRKFSLASVT